MKLVLDKFKQSGKWQDEDSVEVTESDLETIQCWDSDQCLALFNRLRGANYKGGQSSLFIRLEDQPNECTKFIRYLIH